MSLLSLLNKVSEVVFVHIVLNLVLPLLFSSYKMLPPKIIAIGVLISCDSFMFLYSTMDYPACLFFCLYEVLRMLTFISLSGVIISYALPSFLLLSPLMSSSLTL